MWDNALTISTFRIEKSREINGLINELSWYKNLKRY